MPASLQSASVFLVALLTLGPLLAVAAPRLLPPAARDFWGGLGKAGRASAIAILVAIAGLSVSKEPLRSSPSPRPSLPDWFTALGYDPADTDGDGIPDCWERWTRTDPRVADAEQDPDGDDEDNLAEFWNQCDPMCADTDGDGYSDHVEIEGRAAGKAWYDPVVPADYSYDDPDFNTNGIPDRWEGTGYLYGFADANGDGFPDGLSFPAAGDGNFDAEVVVTTSRSALLAWGAETGEALVLPPCTGLVVRLRLSGAADRDVRLSCGTAGDGSAGLWRAGLAARWSERRGQETEGNRIRLGDETVIDFDETEASFRGEVGTEPRRAPRNDPPASVSLPLRRKWIDLDVTHDPCWEHDAGVFEAVATYTNVAPAFAWQVDGEAVPDVPGDTLLGQAAFPLWLDEWSATVRCAATNGPPHESILVEAVQVLTWGHCPPSATNIVGAAWGSTHNPTNAADHLPAAEPESIWQYGPNCPPTTNLLVKAGWTHDTAILWIRNLVRITTGDPQDDETDHCIGLVWRENGSISLYDCLGDCCKPYADKFAYYVNGEPCDGTLEFGAEPGEFHPTVFHVELLSKEGGATLDRMWVVVNASETDDQFGDWCMTNADTSWTDALPKPYAKLQITTNWFGGTSASPVNPTTPNPWYSPSHLSGFLHHDSKWEMRSQKVGDHGNQACYDGNGDIVLSGIAGGTADLYYAGGWTVPEHVSEDVNPYLKALHLDGNPGDTGWLNGISRPCLYQGANLDLYIECRPIIHPEGE